MFLTKMFIVSVGGFIGGFTYGTAISSAFPHISTRLMQCVNICMYVHTRSIKKSFILSREDPVTINITLLKIHNKNLKILLLLQTDKIH